MEDNKFKLELTDGTVIDAEIAGSIDYNNKNYIVLLDTSSEDIYIYRLKDSFSDEYELEDIDNQDELDAVIDELEKVVEG